MKHPQAGISLPGPPKMHRKRELEAAYQQLDQLLVGAATVKVVEAAEKVALARGLALVLSVQNVLVYADPASIVDITDLVKAELRNYL